MFASLRRLFGDTTKEKELKRQKEEEEARERVAAFLLENPEARGLGPIVAGSLGGGGGSVEGLRDGGEMEGYAVPSLKYGWDTRKEKWRQPQDGLPKSGTPTVPSNIPPTATPADASSSTLSTNDLIKEQFRKIAHASAESARRNPPRPPPPNPFANPKLQPPPAPELRSTTPPTTPPTTSPALTLEPPYSRRETLLQQALVERQRTSARALEEAERREKMERWERLEKERMAGPSLEGLRDARAGGGLPVRYEGMELWEAKAQEWMEEGALDKDGMYGDLWMMRQRFARMSTANDNTLKHTKGAPQSPQHSPPSSLSSISSIPSFGTYTPPRPTATNARIREYQRITAPKITRRKKPEPEVTEFPNPKRAKVVKSPPVIITTPGIAARAPPPPPEPNTPTATQPPPPEWRQRLEKLGREALAELQAQEAKEAYEMEVLKRWEGRCEFSLRWAGMG
ncbi:hypothetical protein IAT38_008440 [Cryptococcus sp. DSM 104549]